MMGGGALKAMNDAIKQNRELLKANKKKPFENSGSYKISESLLRNDPKLSNEDRIKIAQSAWEEEAADTRRKIIVLIVTAALIGAAAITILLWV